MPRANWDVLVKYPLPLPPDEMLKEFNNIIADVVSDLRLLMLRNRNLRATRDLLLPMLICGQLDLEALDIQTGNSRWRLWHEAVAASSAGSDDI